MIQSNHRAVTDGIRILVAGVDLARALPFADAGVRAGFPSPAQDYLAPELDFNRDMIRHPEATFYARVTGNSMIGEGIRDGDLLVIDRAEPLREGALAVFAVDGEFTLKRMRQVNGKTLLMPANLKFPPIEVREGQELSLWGVVIYIIKRP